MRRVVETGMLIDKKNAQEESPVVINPENDV